MTATTPVLPADLLEMMARGVSVHVASRDQGLRPSLVRGFCQGPDLALVHLRIAQAITFLNSGGGGSRPGKLR